MKKTYINPTINVVKIQLQQMIAESATTAGFGDGTQDGGNAASRRGSNFWDDEDDYDEEY